MEYSIRLKEKIAVTKDVFHFVFTLEQGAVFSYEPGQYVVMELADDQGTFMRSYSILRYDDEMNTIEFLVKLVDGRGSNVLEEIAAGDEVIIRGPVGRFILQECTDHMVFIGTGTGLTPLIAMIEALPPSIDRITLLNGQRTEDDLYFSKLFDSWKRVETQTTLTQPSENWDGLTGRVYEHLDQFSTDNTSFYLCGSEQMIQDVTAALIERGISEEMIFSELFYR